MNRVRASDRTLQLCFEGWFQCRLATNPDPTDEPRGVSGYTFALPGEPDLDRVIRFHDPVAPRSHGPEVGVTVTSVRLGGQAAADHPLCGATVQLLDAPRFESRNLLLTDDRAGVGLIHPFHLRIAGRACALRREDVLSPGRPEARLADVPRTDLHRRAPLDLDGMTHDPLRIAAATGVVDVRAYRARRRARLQADLDRGPDPLTAAALARRVDELAVDDPHDMRVLAFGLHQSRRFALNGPAEVTGADGLGGEPDPSREWPLAFWMGAWDADALCGFVYGTLEVPLRRA